MGGSVPANNIACWGHSPLGVQEYSKGEVVSIYPNPTTNELRIKSEKLGITSIHIYSLLGELVYSSSSPSGRLAGAVININQFPNGIYFLQLTDPSKPQTPNSQANTSKPAK